MKHPSRIPLLSLSMAFCASLCLAQMPPFSANLLLWFDAGEAADLTLGPGDTVTQWNNRAASANPLALFPASGTAAPVRRVGAGSFGDAVHFGGSSVLELSEETAPEIWEPAGFTTVDGLSAFVVSRSTSVDPVADPDWQRVLGWTQSGSFSNGILRAYSYNDGVPEPYPEGDIHYYYGTGSAVPITNVLLGAKLSGSNFVNRATKVEIAEVLFYNAGFSESERNQILAWLSQRHGLSTDTTNPASAKDPRLAPLKSYVPGTSTFRIAAAANTNFFRVNQDISKNPALARYACTEATLQTHYQMITPTNDFKMGRVAKSFTTTDLTLPHDWSVTDPYVEWSHARGIDLHGHVLVWHKSLPPLEQYTWLGGAWTESQLRTLFEDHILEMVSRYTPSGARPDLAGVVKVWDVVNEALTPAWNWVPDPADPADWQETLRSSIWHDGGDGPGGRPGLGDDFIADAFIAAATARGTADIVLLYNDFNAEEINTKSDAIYKMCVDLLDRGVPIDGVGLQMHVNFYGLDLDSFKANIQRFRALRGGTFEVHITELEAGIPGLVTREKLERQGLLFRDILTAALEADVNSFTTWGIHDIWGDSVDRGMTANLPFSKNMRLSPVTPYSGSLPADHPARRLSFIEPKPAFFGLRDALRDFFNEPGGATLPVTDFSVNGGSIDLAVAVPGPGIIDITAAPNLDDPAMPVGTEGAWRTFDEATGGPRHYTITDPEWNGTDNRFWRAVFHPRPIP